MKLAVHWAPSVYIIVPGWISAEAAGAQVWAVVTLACLAAVAGEAVVAAATRTAVAIATRTPANRRAVNVVFMLWSSLPRVPTGRRRLRSVARAQGATRPDPKGLRPGSHLVLPQKGELSTTAGW